ncbi:hypothetical protein IEQ44_06020 [Nocardioides sp. Y6]|uniref:Uncharacterized protein n=1 Tax=Nocardioides malaquae TaxID=2773426 RepID=A0ABR9RRL1_9ACTN|nr:hypothetical protein [Nocardioides malaquae]MBE7324203.1 hypothetical protein [Nocardioides malaquae]
MTRLERFRGGEVGFVLAIAAREVALGVPTWWYLVLVVVIGVLMIGLVTEDPGRDRSTRSWRPSEERVRLTAPFVAVLLVTAVSSMWLDPRWSMWMASAVSLLIGGVARRPGSGAPLAVPLGLTAGVLLLLVGAAGE